ncbi:MAG: hypothetical protein HW405_862 [Candidatus Berkelbacteria bacterium]|nr:hypothetical protein [Candidatus Berkelbacteria bacterium]
MKNFQFTIFNLQKKAKQGYVTIVILVLMMVLVAASYLYADALFGELIIARNNLGASAAFSMSEAGIQEAIYRIRYDTTARNNFLNTTNGTTTFAHDPALLNSGSYNVTIQNTGLGAATVISTGIYRMGSRTARREVRVDITQATQPPPYDDDGAMFSHSAGGESTGDLEFRNATVTIYGGSLHSGRDIRFDRGSYTAETGIKAERNITTNHDPTINCNCTIDDDGDPLTPTCSDNPGCSYTYTPAIGMPMVDFDSSSPKSYKNQATLLNQYYTSQANFYSLTNFNAGQTKTFNGVVYIEGGISIDQNRTFIMDGVLATSGSISIGGSQNGTLNLSHSGGAGQASGALSQNSFSINNKGNFLGTGLVYAGFRTDIDSSSVPITFTGGILSRRVYVDARVLTIYFDAAVINDTLGQPQDTPVIQINHWEEEY